MNFNTTNFCDLPAEHPPVLVVVIDTEEEFDWLKSFGCNNASVRAIRQIHLVQDIFDDFGIRPVYVIDYPVANQQEGYQTLLRYAKDGKCEIGAHLHPWVTPPFSLHVNRLNSYAGNLPAEIEYQKLASLVNCIRGNLGLQPITYKAGRYGIGPNTPEILSTLGFSVDLSICAGMNYSDDGGPDFSELDARPFWFGPDNSLLELPFTTGYAGLLKRSAKKWHDWALTPKRANWHLVGAFARLNIVNKVRLTPEGHRACELIALTRKLSKNGLCIFSFAFHSPSLVPGCTPYVRTEKQLQDFLKTCRRYFKFFFQDLRGLSMTPSELFNTISNSVDRNKLLS